MLEVYFKYALSILEVNFKYTLEVYFQYIWNIRKVYFTFVRAVSIETATCRIDYPYQNNCTKIIQNVCKSYTKH